MTSPKLVAVHLALGMEFTAPIVRHEVNESRLRVVGSIDRFYKILVPLFNTTDFYFFIIAHNGYNNKGYDYLNKKYQLDKWRYWTAPVKAVNFVHSQTANVLECFILKFEQEFFDHAEKVKDTVIYAD